MRYKQAETSNNLLAKQLNHPHIDPELLDAVSQLQSVLGESTCFNLDDLATAREIVASMAQAGKLAAPPRPSVLIERSSFHDSDLDIDVGVQTYTPKSNAEPQAAILYIHGGGYVFGAADQAEAKLSAWCEDLNVFIVSVDYRLAPEHPFPAGLFDCFATLKWLANSTSKNEFNFSQIAVVGDSAGGGLAAGLCLYARDHSDIEIAFMGLVYPMIDHTNIKPADKDNADTLLWSRANNKFGWEAYLGKHIDKEMLQYAAPATATNLSNLPPCYITVGDQDLFYQENQQFAEDLKSANIETNIDVYAGGFHGFATVAPEAAISKRFNKNLFTALRNALTA